MSIKVFPHTQPEDGDMQHPTLQKTLQRLNTGIAVTNASLQFDSTGRLKVDLPRDLFNRVEVAEPVTLFDSKLDLSERTDQWNSTGSVAHDATRAREVLTVANASSTTTARQTKRSIIYQPGKAQTGVFTFRMGAAATGITRRVGLYCSQEGIFFEQTSAGLRFVIRDQSATSESAEQADWNVDKLDGNGPSGVTIDITRCQIFFIAYEWLGVGTVALGFYYNGAPVVCHLFHHSNQVTQVYMRTPNSPIRFEIVNDGTGAESTFDQICSTVYSSGGAQNQGHLHAVDRQTTALTTLNNANLYPVIAIRLGSVRANAIIENLSMMCTDNSVFWQWQLLLNPSVTGTALSFSDYSEFVQVARPTNATTVSGGTLMAAGYVINATANKPSVNLNPAEDNLLGEQTIGGDTDVVVLAVRRITGTTPDFYGSLTYREIA
jgi:hypothetical protein